MLPESLLHDQVAHDPEIFGGTCDI